MGVTIDGSFISRTTWIETATVSQSVQLANATAALPLSTTSPIARLMANAIRKMSVPSFVLIAIAAVSPPAPPVDPLEAPAVGLSEGVGLLREDLGAEGR